MFYIYYTIFLICVTEFLSQSIGSCDLSEFIPTSSRKIWNYNVLGVVSKYKKKYIAPRNGEFVWEC